LRASRRCRGIVAISALIAIPRGSASAGELYRWVDASGVVHFSDTKTDPAWTRVEDPPPERTRPYRPSREDQEEGFGGEKSPVMVYVGPGQTRAMPRSEFDALLRAAADHYRLPFAFLKAVAKVESNFNPHAVSRAQAKGLMQLIDATANDFQVTNPFDPRQNIFAAARYLRILANIYEGDLARTAAAYNAGPDRVNKAGGVPAIAETQDYVQRVLGLYRLYSRAE
jgi:hypothetical protein